MIFALFSRLYDEALEYPNVEMYIGERGWQAEWMDELADAGEDIGAILSEIYRLAHSNFTELRKRSGLGQRGFSALYGIPERTIANWDTSGPNHREPAAYLIKLLAYTIFYTR